MPEHSALESATVEPLSSARGRLSEIIDDVVATGSVHEITRYGRPAAVVLGHDSYESLIETLNLLSDPDAAVALAEAEADLAAGDLVDLE